MPSSRSPHPSASAAQKEAEKYILKNLAMELGLSYCDPPSVITELKVKLDGFASGRQPVLVEAWAHLGGVKPGQKQKISRDMTKLLLAERKLGKPCRKIIAVMDENAIAFLRQSWDGAFAKEFGIDFVTVVVPEPVATLVRGAQERQYR